MLDLNLLWKDLCLIKEKNLEFNYVLDRAVGLNQGRHRAMQRMNVNEKWVFSGDKEYDETDEEYRRSC